MIVAPPNTRHPSDNPLIGSISIAPMPYDPPILFGTSVTVRMLVVVRELRVAQVEQSTQREHHQEKDTE